MCFQYFDWLPLSETVLGSPNMSDTTTSTTVDMPQSTPEPTLPRQNVERPCNTLQYSLSRTDYDQYFIVVKSRINEENPHMLRDHVPDHRNQRDWREV